MKRLNFIIVFITAIVVLLLGRVYFLSIKSNTYYEELSKQNYIKRVYEAPSRGIIQDRNGVALAINNLGFSISVKPHLRSHKNKMILDKLCETISFHFPEFTKEELIKKYTKLDSAYKHTYVKLIDYIPYDDFFSKYTLFNSMENIQIESAIKRYYPFKNVASHVLGYVGRASREDINNNKVSKYSGIIGKNGLEKFYNEKLQGQLGYKDVKVNALNKYLEILDEKEVSTDNNIKTTLDIELQEFIQKEFADQSGAVIVMNANTGEILSAGSFPEFDNNIFVNGITHKEWETLRNDFNHPFTNKLINGLYPPGSVWKMGVALAFLENGVDINTSLYCSPELKLGERVFRDWKNEGHGWTDFRKAIRESVDVFFYRLSLKIGINEMHDTMGKLGFGEKTGIDQVNEFIGINPSKEWKKERYNKAWYMGETVISSIGQGYVLVTPMQVARYTAFLATGKLPQPHFFEENYKEPVAVDVNPKFLKLIRKGMFDVTNDSNGTAYWHVKNSKVTLAGKTGTAQVIGIPQSEKKRMKEHELEYYERSHAWLTTYAPYENPQYVITVIVEHGGHGGSAAGDLTAKIYNKMIALGYIQKN
ncbi:MAG: penicillin-binding protein 2 [Candidatus Marinarcus sp.]|uniref:penicillin-binding protein 2 n=1 Tax=Candidatus Marinarcus sp. TaxID=3100987 RepID=UPI003AFFC8AB